MKISASALLFFALRSVEGVRTTSRILRDEGGKGGKGKTDAPTEAPVCPEECAGVTYWKLVDLPGGAQVDWSVPLESTTEGCVLAPVTSADDLAEIQQVAGGTNAWVGIVKSIADVQAATTQAENAENWSNIDGTEVPADLTLWASGEPNNSPPFQTRAHYYGSNGSFLLRDLNPAGNSGPDVGSAVYKCCFEIEQCNV